MGIAERPKEWTIYGIRPEGKLNYNVNDRGSYLNPA